MAGVRDAGKSKLIEAAAPPAAGDLADLEGKLASLGGDETGLERLKTAKIVEIDYYTASEPGKESARNRSTRRHAVSEAIESDLLILVVDAQSTSHDADVSFLNDWAKWYADHPGLQVPPTLAVMTHVDSPMIAATEWKPPFDWLNGKGPREAAVRSELPGVQGRPPPDSRRGHPGRRGSQPRLPGVVESLLPTLTAFCHRAERNALLRHLRAASARHRGRSTGPTGRTTRQIAVEDIEGPRQDEGQRQAARRGVARRPPMGKQGLRSRPATERVQAFHALPTVFIRGWRRTRIARRPGRDPAISQELSRDRVYREVRP